jgi:hypothetical protein
MTDYTKGWRAKNLPREDFIQFGPAGVLRAHEALVTRTNAELDALHTELEARGQRIAELEAQVADLKHWSEHACETPDPKCDCPGCSLARESFTKEENYESNEK